ncbi:MAG: universal stress protein [Rhodospirillales bacterium]|nr:universal stress protein [Rhodospirillales bacterium]
MIEPAPPPVQRVRFRRVLLALGTASGDPATVERAAALAARLRGDLLAVYVEDIDVARLAEFASVSTLSTVTAATHPLATGHLRDTLRLQVARLRRELEQAALRRRVKLAFQVRQGRLLAEVLSAATDEDLVVLSWAAGDRVPPPWAAALPPTVVAHGLAAARARSVLLLHAGAPATGSVLIAFDGSEAARHALSLGAQVAELEEAPVEVVLLDGRLDQLEYWRKEIATALAQSHLSLAFVTAPKAGLQALTEIAFYHRSRLLVLDADRALAEGDVGRRLLSRLFCSVLLVR